MLQHLFLRKEKPQQQPYPNRPNSPSASTSASTITDTTHARYTAFEPDGTQRPDLDRACA